MKKQLLALLICCLPVPALATGFTTDPSGNTGIGTASPPYMLSVFPSTAGYDGIYTLQQSSTGVALIQASNSSSNNIGIFVGQTGQTVRSEYGLTGNFGDVTSFGMSGFAVGTADSNPLILGTDTTERVRITSSGTVGIGTSSPRGGALLDVNGEIYVGSFASSSSTTVCQNGNVLSSCSSALRFKENVRPAAPGLKEVLEMKPVTFDFRDHKDNWEKHDFGFIAEDMEKINPLFVTYNANGTVDGVRYMQLTAVDAKAIQELYDIIVKQNAELTREQHEIDELENTIQLLKEQY